MRSFVFYPPWLFSRVGYFFSNIYLPFFQPCSAAMIKLRYVFLVAAVVALVYGEPASAERENAQQLLEALEASPGEAPLMVREKRHLLAKKALLLGGGALLGKKALVLGGAALGAKALLGAGAVGAGLYHAKSAFGGGQGQYYGGGGAHSQYAPVYRGSYYTGAGFKGGFTGGYNGGYNGGYYNGGSNGGYYNGGSNGGYYNGGSNGYSGGAGHHGYYGGGSYDGGYYNGAGYGSGYNGGAGYYDNVYNNNNNGGGCYDSGCSNNGGGGGYYYAQPSYASASASAGLAFQAGVGSASNSW